MPARGAQLRLRGGKIEPQICAASVGGEIVFTSEDETFSDVSAYYGLTELAFHRKFVLAGDRFSFTPVRPGLMLFEDENRPSDRAYLYVAPTPAFAVAGEDGRYEIARAPAGRRRFTAWNLEKGVRDAEATVRKGETTVLDFPFH
jgi:hypothetical protein